MLRPTFASIADHVAAELEIFRGVRVSDILCDTYAEYTGSFPAKTIQRLRDHYPYRDIGLPPFAPATRMRAPGDLASDRNAILDYVDRLHNLAPSYATFVDNMAEKMDPLDKHCRLVILIPAQRESGTLRRGLDNILIRRSLNNATLAQIDRNGLAMHPSMYEVIVLVNRDHLPEPDLTALDVAEFRQEHSSLDLKIHVLDVQFPAQVAGIGAARKLLQDVALVRAANHASRTNRLLLATSDADVLNMPRNAFVSWMVALDENPQVPSALMRVDIGNSLLTKVPFLYLAQRVHRTATSIVKSSAFSPERNSRFHATLNRSLIQGNSAVFSASDLARTGGFSVCERAEDLIVDEQLAMYFGNIENGGRLRMSTRLHRHLPLTVTVSPRRLLASYILGARPYHEGQFTSQSMTSMTRRDLSELLTLAGDVGEEGGIATVESALYRQGTYICQTSPNGNSADHYLRLLMYFCGFDRSHYRLTADGSGVVASGRSIVEVARRWSRWHALSETVVARNTAAMA